MVPQQCVYSRQSLNRLKIRGPANRTTGVGEMKQIAKKRRNEAGSDTIVVSGIVLALAGAVKRRGQAI